MTSKALEPIPWLRPLSWLYAAGVTARNCAIDLDLSRVRRLPVPVVSVGNLSVGGTGKTPFIALLIERMRARGLRVGVLARGYGRKTGEQLNDEGRMLAQRFPQLPQEQDPVRFDAGERLLAQHELDVILLDDGYQHRKLARDVDICLVDARKPRGGGLLPAGYLREPFRQVRRADVVVLTHAAGLSPATLAARVADLQRYTRAGSPCFAAATRARDVLELPAGIVRDASVLRGVDVYLVAGIARPERFVESVNALGSRVVESCFVRDHAEITVAELEGHVDRARAMGARVVLTEKDEARMAFVAGDGPERTVLRVETEFVGADPGVEPFLPASLRGRVT